jgi:hypothetical protein
MILKGKKDCKRDVGPGEVMEGKYGDAGMAVFL